MEQLTGRHLKDLKILASFIHLYCQSHHAEEKTLFHPLPKELCSAFNKKAVICPDCMAILEHGIRKRALCPLEPKPSCKKCHIHCYKPEYRQKIREIMAFSGRKMLLKGRLDYLWHYYAG